MMSIPIYAEDLYTDQNILEPYEHYRKIRELGPVVNLTTSNVLAVARYRDVKKTLLDHKHFVSGKGVALSEATNEVGIGNTLMSDPPTHQHLRSVISAPLTPASVEEMRAQIQLAANDLITRLVAQGSFDGVADLARFLPVTIVSRLVGLPEDGRENMLDWAAATFEVMGPLNARCQDAFPKLSEMLTYVAEKAGPDRVIPGSWAAKIHEAAKNGLIKPEQVNFLMVDYLGPSLDTTIFATSYMLKLFGENPEQWALLKSNPDLIPNAVNEVVRLESPIRGFSRVAKDDCEIDGIRVPADSRILILYASANRDEHQWDEPERFNIQRHNAKEQLGFGIGRHVCAGQHLARLEIQCLLRAMIARIKSFEVGNAVPQLNNTLRGLARLPVKICA